MPKNNNRQGRIDEEFRKELSQLISFELKEPSVTGMVSVTKVKVTPDLKYAKVSEIMACGDGGNDIPMLKAAGIGVAMGNASEKVQSVADFVTDTVDNSGLYKALKHFGVI